MITREEYNKALDVIEKYHLQIFNIPKKEELRDISKTRVEDWDKLHSCSTRLYNILTCKFYWNEQKETMGYIEDIDKIGFLRQRYAGKKLWNEFKELRGY